MNGSAIYITFLLIFIYNHIEAATKKGDENNLGKGVRANDLPKPNKGINITNTVLVSMYFR